MITKVVVAFFAFSIIAGLIHGPEKAERVGGVKFELSKAMTIVTIETEGERARRRLKELKEEQENKDGNGSYVFASSTTLTRENIWNGR